MAPSLMPTMGVTSLEASPRAVEEPPPCIRRIWKGRWGVVEGRGGGGWWKEEKSGGRRSTVGQERVD